MDVTNTGEVKGTYAAILTINGVTVKRKNISVAGGATESVTFTVVKDESGTYSIGVNGLSKRLTVKVKLTIIPPVEQEIPPAGLLYRHYEWNFNGRKYTWDVSIPVELYVYYQGRTRPPTKNFSVYVTNPNDDNYLKSLVEAINSAALRDGFTEADKINFVVAFLQRLPYTPDNVTTPYDEYPRYPVETLVDNGGDCEDTSILMAALLDGMGHDAILISLPEHMAVGISGKDVFYGNYYELDTKQYFYIETTAEGWKIGQVPDEYKGKSAYLYRIEPTPILTHSWEAKYITSDTIELTVVVKNEGTAIARDAYVFAGFDAGENKLWNPKKSDNFTLPPGSKVTATLRPTVPNDKYTRLVVQTVHGGYAVHESYSEWFNT